MTAPMDAMPTPEYPIEVRWADNRRATILVTSHQMWGDNFVMFAENEHSGEKWYFPCDNLLYFRAMVRGLKMAGVEMN